MQKIELILEHLTNQKVPTKKHLPITYLLDSRLYLWTKKTYTNRVWFFNGDSINYSDLVFIPNQDTESDRLDTSITLCLGNIINEWRGIGYKTLEQYMISIAEGDINNQYQFVKKVCT